MLLTGLMINGRKACRGVVAGSATSIFSSSQVASRSRFNLLISLPAKEIASSPLQFSTNVCGKASNAQVEFRVLSGATPMVI